MGCLRPELAPNPLLERAVKSSLHRPWLLLAVAAFSAGAHTTEVVTRLKRHGQVTCEPNGDYFCANMHVSCAGRTTVPTFPFSIRVTPAGIALEAPHGAEAFAEQYAGAEVEWGREDHHVIIRPARAGGYIQLFQDGKYVFRHYPNAEGVMSRGSCA